MSLEALEDAENSEVEAGLARTALWLLLATAPVEGKLKAGPYFGARQDCLEKDVGLTVLDFARKAPSCGLLAARRELAPEA